MKLKFLATGQAPDTYEIQHETINGFDLSIVEHGGEFLASDHTRASGLWGAERDVSGVLWVTLCQKVGPGCWAESEWIDSSDYDPDAIYVTKLDEPYAGDAYAKNGRGERVYV